MATAKEVATWMMGEVEKSNYVYQDAVAHRMSAFGEGFTYRNKNGNLAIKKEVLKEFEKLSKDTVVWSRAQRAWRKRTPHDAPQPGACEGEVISD
jgi:hypothetical protein